ncbi:hypothetical protein FIBSPDRAFT_884449 [Athelia psychrophila]|uniref:Uncharacterized protein n=1 Tax=Athelia psychrophila TaxID=1759441 RepID=A0A166T4R1_9AGAM|nr:hypothetical protein FIBSPDRAFT_884449 [Fibularhizoctonia sp. CBS 109695]
MLFLRACILSLTTLSLTISTTIAVGNTTCATDSLDCVWVVVPFQYLFNPSSSCQQGTGSGVGQDFGIDGPDGLYDVYLDGCAPVANSTLPTDIQAAVCNDKIKIEDDLYSIFPGDGDCMITRETIQKDQQAYWNNTFTQCPFSVVDNSTHPTVTPSAATTGSTPTGTMLAMQNQTSPSRPWNYLSGGAIAGIVIGSVAPLALVVAFTIWYFGYRKKDEWNYADVQLQPFLLEPSTQERPTSYHPAPLTPGLGSGSVPSTPSFAAPYTDVAPPVQPVRSSTALTTQSYISELPYPGTSSYIPHLPYPGPVPSVPRAPIRSSTVQTYDTYVTYPELASPTQDGPPSSTERSSTSERHADAGVLLARSQSGRLPPLSTKMFYWKFNPSVAPPATAQEAPSTHTTAVVAYALRHKTISLPMAEVDDKAKLMVVDIEEDTRLDEGVIEIDSDEEFVP